MTPFRNFVGLQSKSSATLRSLSLLGLFGRISAGWSEAFPAARALQWPERHCITHRVDIQEPCASHRARLEPQCIVFSSYRPQTAIPEFVAQCCIPDVSAAREHAQGAAHIRQPRFLACRSFAWLQLTNLVVSSYELKISLLHLSTPPGARRRTFKMKFNREADGGRPP